VRRLYARSPPKPVGVSAENSPVQAQAYSLRTAPTFWPSGWGELSAEADGASAATVASVRVAVGRSAAGEGEALTAAVGPAAADCASCPRPQRTVCIGISNQRTGTGKKGDCDNCSMLKFPFRHGTAKV